MYGVDRSADEDVVVEDVVVVDLVLDVDVAVVADVDAVGVAGLVMGEVVPSSACG